MKKTIQVMTSNRNWHVISVKENYEKKVIMKIGIEKKKKKYFVKILKKWSKKD